MDEITRLSLEESLAGEKVREVLADPRIGEEIKNALLRRLNSPHSKGQPLSQLTFTYFKLVISLSNIDTASLQPESINPILEKSGLSLSQDDGLFSEELCLYFKIERDHMLHSELFQELALKAYFKILEKDIQTPGVNVEASKMYLTNYIKHFVDEEYLAKVTTQQEIAQQYVILFDTYFKFGESTNGLIEAVQVLLHPPVILSQELEATLPKVFENQVDTIFKEKPQDKDSYSELLSLFIKINPKLSSQLINDQVTPRIQEGIAAFLNIPDEKQSAFLTITASLDTSCQQLAKNNGFPLPHFINASSPTVQAMLENAIVANHNLSTATLSQLLTIFPLDVQTRSTILSRSKVRMTGNQPSTASQIIINTLAETKPLAA